MPTTQQIDDFLKKGGQYSGPSTNTANYSFLDVDSGKIPFSGNTTPVNTNTQGFSGQYFGPGYNSSGQPISNTTPVNTTAPTVQPRPGVTQSENNLNVTEDIYSKLTPAQIAAAKEKGYNVQTGQPTNTGTYYGPGYDNNGQPIPGYNNGSVSGILGDMGMSEDEKWLHDYYAKKRAELDTPIDEESIYQEKLKQNQAQIDAVNALYADKLRGQQVISQGNLGSSRAIQARSGLLGSDFGSAQTSRVQTSNQQAENLVEQERLAVVNQILSGAKESAQAEIAAKRQAINEGGKSLLEYYAGASERKNARTSEQAKKLLALGKSPDDLTQGDWSQLEKLGINRNDLTAMYNEGKSAIDAQTATANLATAKTQAEIDKLNFDMSKNYEVGGRIYNAEGVEIAQKVGNNYEAGGNIYEAGTNKFLGKATKPADATLGGGISASGDLRQYASQFPNEASLKNNNPAGITYNDSFAQRLQQAGIQFTKGTNRPAAEGGAYFGFPSIEEGFKAYDLLWSSPSYTNLTVNQALNRWNTGSTERGYGTQITGTLGINGNTSVSQLTSEQLKSIQMEQLKRESPGMYKLLNSGTGATGDTGGYNPDFESYYKQVNTGKGLNATETKILEKEFGSIGEFQKQAKAYGQKIALEQGLPALQDYKADLQWLKDNFSLLGKAGALVNVGNFDAVLNNVKNKTAFKELTRLKEMGATFGALSEKEFANIGSSTETGKLKLTAGKEVWDTAIDRLLRDLAVAEAKITGGQASTNTPSAPSNTSTDPYAQYLKSIGQ